MLIDASALTREQAVDALVEFVTANGLAVLNVAGPRASKWPGAFEYAQALVAGMSERLTLPT